MGPLYFLIVAIFLPTGELQLDVKAVNSCTNGKEQLVELLDAKVHTGEIVEWNAACITVGDKGHAI